MPTGNNVMHELQSEASVQGRNRDPMHKTKKEPTSTGELKPFVFFHGETVGHAGDVVGHHPFGPGVG